MTITDDGPWSGFLGRGPPISEEPHDFYVIRFGQTITKQDYNSIFQHFMIQPQQ